MKILLIGAIVTFSSMFGSQSFSYKDWEVVCDNTNTCRMAGYTEYTMDKIYFPISLYFERKAGKNTLIESKIVFADYIENIDKKRLKNHTFKISIGSENLIIDLSKKIPQKVTDTMIDALIKNKKIYFTYGDAYKWDFTEEGSFAVMTKIDDFQKRIGTVGAMFKKGQKNETRVRPPNQIPVIYIPKPIKNIQKIQLSEKNSNLLNYWLKEYYSKADNAECWENFGEVSKTREIYRLNDKTALVSQQCWMAAYNFANGYWLINTKPPFDPRFVTSASDLDITDGRISISNSQKGRGVGDCWSRETFVWDGEKFVQSASSSTGQCRGFVGGAWNFPTLITQVKVEK